MPSRPHQREKSWLTPEQEAIVRKAIASGLTRDQAAAAAGISVARLWSRLRDQLADVRVGRGRRPTGPKPVDPTPAEIAAATLAIRKTWTPDRWGAQSPWSADDPRGHGRAAPQS